MEEREIGEADEGARQRILVAVRIDLEDRIARLAGRPLRDDRELDEALIALVAVEIVVIIAGQRALFEEIGRASCREIEGQYVYIKVVAGSLQKIHTHRTA